MFHLTMTTPCDIAGTIRFKSPFRGLGNYEDVDGKLWNVAGFWGGEKPIVNAVPVSELHPHWGSTAGWVGGLASQAWPPYYAEFPSD